MLPTAGQMSTGKETIGHAMGCYSETKAQTHVILCSSGPDLCSPFDL